jgi:hypothetical protein
VVFASAYHAGILTSMRRRKPWKSRGSRPSQANFYPLGWEKSQNSINSSPLLAGNPLNEWAMMSVWTWSARWNRVAIPCGLDPSEALSATVGIPPEAENRTVTGVEGREACGALVSVVASGDGVNVPENITPLA